LIDEQADLHPLLRQHRRLSLAQRRLQPRHSRFAAAVAAARSRRPSIVAAKHHADLLNAWLCCRLGLVDL